MENDEHASILSCQCKREGVNTERIENIKQKCISNYDMNAQRLIKISKCISNLLKWIGLRTKYSDFLKKSIGKWLYMWDLPINLAVLNTIDIPSQNRKMAAKASILLRKSRENDVNDNVSAS